ncbi:ABC transporter substrate-binding protein [Paenibacillus sp. JDR-2]|uniref:ABC transporter substrate-binding protein n=1 Tax=Paenibacillus sp. (strain JDR-2) TaxID=324057 RepID=UPI000166A2E9|nr:extracellular solute-binding protein [Paenibacillus sp. JDR-2]ACT00648.1 extracellular solute-binding protein family 1 [Paenibacillus sp. JDR-2]
MMRTISLLLTLIVLASGCGQASQGEGEGGSGDTSDDTVTFTVVFPGGDLAHKQGVSTVIAEFEKSHPNIVINEVNESWSGTYGEFVKVKEAVGEFPDLVEMRDTQLFADAGLLYEIPRDITDLLQPIPAVNGHVYNAPLDIPPPNGIIYSKSIFRKAGINKPPATYEEFLAVCQRIRNLGIDPIVVGGKDVWHIGFWVNKFLIDEVYIQDPDWNAKRSAGKVSWTDDAPMRAMRKLKQLWDSGDVAKGYLSTADSQTVSILTSGQAAMLYSGPWMFNQIRSSDPTFEFGFFALPDSAGKVSTTGLNVASGWSISAEAAKDPEKLISIKQFLHFFYSEEPYSHYLEAINGIAATVYPVTYSAPEQMSEVFLIANNKQTGKSSYMNLFSGANSLPPRFRDWFYRTVLDMTDGKISLQDAMQAADKEWDSELASLQ